MEVEVNVASVPSVTPAASRSICVRAGCTNPAVDSKDWDKEYCSNECVATHCRCVHSYNVTFSHNCKLLSLLARRSSGSYSRRQPNKTLQYKYGFLWV